MTLIGLDGESDLEAAVIATLKQVSKGNSTLLEALDLMPWAIPRLERGMGVAEALVLPEAPDPPGEDCGVCKHPLTSHRWEMSATGRKRQDFHCTRCNEAPCF